MTAAATVVVFRVWRDGGVFALFPCEPWCAGMVASYEHVGQHGGADYAGCIGRSRAATAEESAPLRRELESRGYQLAIRQRRPPRR